MTVSEWHAYIYGVYVRGGSAYATRDVIDCVEYDTNNVAFN